MIRRNSLMATITFFQKSYWRRPIVAAVSFAVPLLFIIGFPLQAVRRAGSDGLSGPAFALTGMVGFSAVFCTYIVAQAIAGRRASLFYKRLRANGVRGRDILVGETCCALLPFVVVIAVGAVTGFLTHTSFGARWLLVLVAALLAAVLHILLGLAIVSLVSGADVVMFVVSPLLIASLYLSGVTFSPHALAPPVLAGATYLPLTMCIDLIRTVAAAAYAPLLPLWGDVLGLLAWGALFTTVIIRTFRWDPRRAS